MRRAMGLGSLLDSRPVVAPTGTSPAEAGDLGAVDSSLATAKQEDALNGSGEGKVTEKER